MKGTAAQGTAAFSAANHTCNPPPASEVVGLQGAITRAGTTTFPFWLFLLLSLKAFPEDAID